MQRKKAAKSGLESLGAWVRKRLRGNAHPRRRRFNPCRLRFESLEDRSLLVVADIVDVWPDPRNTPVANVAVNFTEPVFGVSSNGFRLTRNGEAVDLSGISIQETRLWTYAFDLSAVTTAEGRYQFTLVAQNSGITDRIGEPLQNDAVEEWLTDMTRPIADFVAVTPDPRNSTVGNVVVNFDEYVTGVSIEDFQLTRDGQPVDLAGVFVSPITPMQYVIDLSSVTVAEGEYQLDLIVDGSAIQDRAGNALAASVVEDWRVDVTAPIADILDVSPDPRNGEVSIVRIHFDEPVTGLSLDDLRLTLGGEPIDLSSLVMTQINPLEYTLDLSSVTTRTGSYQLTLVAANSEIVDQAANKLQRNAVDDWFVADIPLITDPGIVARDTATGDIWATRFNGSDYIHEKIFDMASAYQWQTPLTADTDGDGRDEVLARDAATGAWWRIQYDGARFESKIIGNWSPTFGYADLQIADINGDGRSDVVGRNSSGSWWALVFDGTNYQNQFLNGWNTTATYRNLMTADIDGDGRDNVIGQDIATGKWWAIRHDGAKFFSQNITKWNGVDDYAGAYAADVDGDGRKDIVGFNRVTGEWRTISFDGTKFTDQIIANWDPSSEWLDILVGDIDGDKRADLVGRESRYGNWWVIRNTDSTLKNEILGNWNPVHQYLNVQLADINGDGAVDLIGRNSTGAWWAAEYDGTRLRNRFLGGWNISDRWENLMVRDIDGDGKENVVGRNADTGDWWAIHAFGSEYESVILARWNRDLLFMGINAADLDGNGIQEIIGWDTYNGDWYRLHYEVAGFKSQVISNWKPRPQLVDYTEVQLADLDGVNGPELIGWDARHGNWWATLIGPSGATQKFLGHWSTTVNWGRILYGDIDGDGRADIVARDPVSGDWWAIRYNGTTITNGRIGNWNPTNSYSHISLADMNGNGHMEIVGLDSTGSWWTVTFDNPGFQNHFLGGWNNPALWRDILIADIDGDGRSDVLGRHAPSGNWQAIRFNGTTFTNLKIGNWNPLHEYSHVQIADINGDGVGDLVGQNDRGSWWAGIFGGTTLQNVFLNGWNATIPWINLIVADTDGDGRAEVIGMDPTTGSWWAIRFGGSGYFSQRIGNWLPNHIYQRIYAIDLNGDRRTDIVAQDLTSGEWLAIQYDGTKFHTQTFLNWNPSRTWDDIVFGEVPGVSNAMLRKQIIDEIPGLLNTLAADRLAAARALLDWSANKTDYALDPAVERITSSYAASNSVANVYYYLFSPSQGGGWCGVFAQVYDGILKIFGYQSFTVDFGDIRDGLTHVSVIVPVKNADGADRYYMFDPLFNVTYHDRSTDNLLTYFDMLDYVNAGRVADIEVVRGTVEQRDWISTIPMNTSELVLDTQVGNFWVYAYSGYGLDVHLRDNEALFVANGYSPGMTGWITLMQTRVFNVGQSLNPDVAAGFVSELRARNIAI